MFIIYNMYIYICIYNMCICIYICIYIYITYIYILYRYHNTSKNKKYPKYPKMTSPSLIHSWDLQALCHSNWICSFCFQVSQPGHGRCHNSKTYWCLAGNGWEWGNGMIITSDYGSFNLIPYQAPVRKEVAYVAYGCLIASIVL